MPAKKAKAPAANDGNMSYLKWVYVFGVIIAGLVFAFGLNVTMPWIVWLLAIVGLVTGFFYHDPADIQNFGLRYLIAVALAAGAPVFIGTFPVIGTFVSGFLQGFAMFLGPVVLAMAILHFTRKYSGE